MVVHWCWLSGHDWFLFNVAEDDKPRRDCRNCGKHQKGVTDQDGTVLTWMTLDYDRGARSHHAKDIKS